MSLAARIRAARKAYLRHPTRATLRLLLIRRAQKAVKDGHVLAGFDPRMCRYYGVSAKVNDGCKRGIVRGYARGLVPTSTTAGSHAPGSFHLQRNDQDEGEAVDLGLIETHIGTEYGRDKMVNHQRAELHRFRAGHEPRMVELIGPDNAAIVLRGRETDLVEGTALETAHDNHVHEAYTGH